MAAGPSTGVGAAAIGGACGRNPLPIVIPCHRVVGGAGEGGYSGLGGLTTKDWLLNHEMAIVASRCLTD